MIDYQKELDAIGSGMCAVYTATLNGKFKFSSEFLEYSEDKDGRPSEDSDIQYIVNCTKADGSAFAGNDAVKAMRRCCVLADNIAIAFNHAMGMSAASPNGWYSHSEANGWTTNGDECNPEDEGCAIIQNCIFRN